MLRLTPAQVVELTQVTDETLRHWRKVLAPLRGFSGRGPCFLPGDALALMIVRCLVKDLGLQVRMLAGLAPRLFEICRTTSWPKLVGVVLLLRPDRDMVEAVQDGKLTSDGVSIVVPVRYFTDALQGNLLANVANGDQIPLRLWPSVVRRTKTGR